MAKVLAELELDRVDIVVADLDDTASLQTFARWTAVVLNLASPYTQKVLDLIAARFCVGHVLCRPER